MRGEKNDGEERGLRNNGRKKKICEGKERKKRKPVMVKSEANDTVKKVIKTRNKPKENNKPGN